MLLGQTRRNRAVGEQRMRVNQRHARHVDLPFNHRNASLRLAEEEQRVALSDRHRADGLHPARLVFAQIRRALFRHEHHLLKPLRGQRLKQLRKDG